MTQRPAKRHNLHARFIRLESHGTQAEQPVIPRRFLAPLVICGPVTAAVLATLLAAAFLAQQLADAVLARGLLIAAVAAAAVLLVNVLVIVTTLGIRAVEEEPVRAIADGQYFSNRRNAKAARDLERV